MQPPLWGLVLLCRTENSQVASLCELQRESRIAKLLTRLRVLIGYFRMRKDMTLVPKVLFTFLPGHVDRLITSSFLLCSLSAT